MSTVVTVYKIGNGPLVVVKDLLGHAQINTTADIYAHVRLRLQRDAIEAMSAALNNPDHDEDGHDKQSSDDEDGDRGGDLDDPPILVPA